MQLIETLPARQYFAASPIDTTWHYDPSTLTAAAGQHVNVDGVVPEANGQYLLIGKTARNDTLVARLNENGRLDATFGHGGVADPVIHAGTDVVHAAADALGYTYLYTQTTVTRLRGNGTRDVGYGRRGRVDFGFAGASGPLDAEADNAGGLDVVVRGDSTASLVHINSVGTAGVLWSGRFRGNTDPAAGNYSVITFGRAMHLNGGKFVVVISRQGYGDNPDPDSAFAAEIGGDADVYYLSQKGAVLGTNHFDTGVAVSRADSNRDADPVNLYYGRRKLYINSGHKFHRATLNFTETPNLPSGGLLTLKTDALPHTGAATTYVTSATLYDPSGSLSTSLDRTGSYSLIDRINASAAVVDVFAPRQNDVLVGAYVPERDHRGREIPGSDDLNLLRLWTTDNVSATLVSATAKKRVATVTVRYRAKGQIDDATIGNGNLNLVTRGGTRIPMRLVSQLVNADFTVTSQYAATVPVTGDYDIETIAFGVVSTRNYGSAPARIGTVVA